MVGPVTSSEHSVGESIFQTNWNVYKKMIENNYLFHHDVYRHLHNILKDEIARPYSFLDIACGDGTASIMALRGTPIIRYFGMDQSRAALDMADQVLRELSCSLSLIEGDFPALVQAWREPVDVVWIGLSLHHLLRPGKLKLMSGIRNIVARDGRFLIYENTSPADESRSEWLDRWLLQKPSWTAYNEDDWDAMWAHVSNCDFPETDRTWHNLGDAAGFTQVRELFRAPTDLFRMYEFR